MKKLTLSILLTLAILSARAGVPWVFLPSTAVSNTPSLLNSNFADLDARWASLTDADTNAMVRSPRMTYWSTNALNLTNAAIYQLPITVTNPESISYTILAGQPDLYWAPAGTTNWTIGGVTTNVPISFMFLQAATPSVTTPIPPVITNVTVYTLARPDLFGRTNQLYGQFMRVGTPLDPSDATPKSYVDALVASVSYIQNGGIFLQSSALNLSGEWSEQAGTNGLSWKYLGTESLRLENPALTLATITSIKMTNTVVWLTIWTNGVTSIPSPQWTKSLVSPNWQTLSSVTNTYPTPGGTNYTISFQRPDPTNAFIRVGLVAAGTPNFLRLSSILASSPRTITNSSDTTWGAGAGLVTWDTNYLYISVGTNVWKRTTLSTY